MKSTASSRLAKTERLAVRLTRSQDEVIRRAAEARGEPLSEYVVRHVVEAAEFDLADRLVFVLEDTAWNELQVRLSAPPVPKPRLSKLLQSPSILEKE
jgi:uncharacterized protein (DUF1778 family)